jgi:hypothetical protein
MEQQEIDWIRAGANLIIHSADIIAFSQTIRAEVNRIKQAVGDAGTQSSGDDINI